MDGHAAGNALNPENPPLTQSGEGPSSSRGAIPRSAEGLIFKLGCALGLGWLLALGLGWFWDAQTAKVLTAVTTANMFFGRGGGMALGYAEGLGHWIVIAANLLIETIQVLIIYPLFVFSWHHLIEIRTLRRAMRRIRKAAESRQDWIRKYGLVGLFLFVCTPFVMTGPVVGAIVGFMIGLRPAMNMAVVLPATYLAILAWGFVLGGVHEWASEYNRYVPFGLIVSVTILVLLGRWLGKWLAKGR